MAWRNKNEEEFGNGELGNLMAIRIFLQARAGGMDDLALRDEGEGKPLAWVIGALKRIKGVGGILLAVPEKGDNEALASLAREHGIELFKGPEEPLERLIAAGYRYGFNTALRVSANMPFIDPSLSEALLRIHAEEGADFSRGGYYPLGVVPEVISLKALREAGPTPAIAYKALLGGGKGKQGLLRSASEYLDTNWKLNCEYDYEMALAARKALGASQHDFPALETALPDIIYSLLSSATDTPRKRHLNGKLGEIETSLMTPMARSVPGMIALEPDSACNIRCVTCPHHFTKVPGEEFDTLFSSLPPRNLLEYSTFKKDENGDYSKQSVPLFDAVFDKVEKELFPFSRAVCFGIYGEALINRKTPEYVKRTKDAGLLPHLKTNGTMLTEKKARELIQAGLHWVGISFDGASREVFEGIREGAGFERVSSNVRSAVRVKRELGLESPVIQLSFTASARNIHELPAIVHLAGEWGVDIVDLNLCFISSHMDPNDSLYFHRDLTRECIARALSAAVQNGVGITMTKASAAFYEGRVVDEYCRAPWTDVAISPSGNVQLCCCKYLEKAGNLMEEGFMAVRNSPAFVEFRRGFRDKAKMHPLCVECVGGISEPPNPASFMTLKHRVALGLEASVPD